MHKQYSMRSVRPSNQTLETLRGWSSTSIPDSTTQTATKLGSVESGSVETGTAQTFHHLGTEGAEGALQPKMRPSKSLALSALESALKVLNSCSAAFS